VDDSIGDSLAAFVTLDQVNAQADLLASAQASRGDNQAKFDALTATHAHMTKTGNANFGSHDIGELTHRFNSSIAALDARGGDIEAAQRKQADMRPFVANMSLLPMQ